MLAIKLLNYGDEDDDDEAAATFQIRPGQALSAVSKLNSEHSDCLAFQYAKVLKSLLGISDVGSYLMKKVFLSQSNQIRKIASMAASGKHERMGLFSILNHPELRPVFEEKRVHFEHTDFQSKLIIEGIILLK